MEPKKRRGHTIISPCECYHKAQDEMYGKGMRVKNWARKAGMQGGWRCTVCSREEQA